MLKTRLSGCPNLKLLLLEDMPISVQALAIRVFPSPWKRAGRRFWLILLGRRCRSWMGSSRSWSFRTFPRMQEGSRILRVSVQGSLRL